MNKIFVVDTEVHQNPSKPLEWAFSFLYDSKGEDGDIMRVGREEEMKALELTVKELVVGKEYDEAREILRSHHYLMDRWTKLRSINDIIKYVEANPQYKHFLDKDLVVHVCDGIRVRGDDWQHDPHIRFSVDHDQLVIETD